MNHFPQKNISMRFQRVVNMKPQNVEQQIVNRWNTKLFTCQCMIGINLKEELNFGPRRKLDGRGE